MTKLLEVLLLNAAACTVLAAAVWTMGLLPAVRRRPALRYGLWMIVLVKLVTPPIVELRLLPTWNQLTQSFRPEPVPSPKVEAPIEIVPGVTTQVSSPVVMMDVSPVETPATATVGTPFDWRPWLLVASMAGTALVLAISVCQVRRLRRALRLGSANDPRITCIVRRAAGMMGLSGPMRVSLVNASVSPLLWVGRGEPLIVLPRGLVDDLSDEQLTCVVCHEMAHYLRRDHWGNTASWLVAVLFWWHPVVWWVRRELRTSQEACCDALVISRSVASRQSYAKTLFQALEFLQSRNAPLPALASGFGGKSSTQRRFEMIANPKVNHRLSWWNYLILLAALAALPLWPALISAEEVALSDCPESVQSTLQALEGAGQILKIVRDADGEEQFYEAEISINGKVYDVRVSGQGTLLSTVYSRSAGEGSVDVISGEAAAQSIELPQATIDFVTPEGRLQAEIVEGVQIAESVDAVAGVLTVDGYQIIELDDNGALSIQLVGPDERVVAEENAAVVEQRLRAEIEALMAQLKELEAQAALNQRQAEILAEEYQAQQQQQIMEAQRQLEAAARALDRQVIELQIRAEQDEWAARRDAIRERISGGLPEAIQATLDREAEGAGILQVTVTANEEGTVTYTVQVCYDTESGPRQYELMIDEQGELLHKRLQRESEFQSIEVPDGGRIQFEVAPVQDAEASSYIEDVETGIVEYFELIPEEVETQRVEDVEVQLQLIEETGAILELEATLVPYGEEVQLEFDDASESQLPLEETFDQAVEEESLGEETSVTNSASEAESTVDVDLGPAEIEVEEPAAP